MKNSPEGFLVQKNLQGRAANRGSKMIKSASWYMNGPLKNSEFGIWMGGFSNFPNFGQNWPKFKKILEKSTDFAQKYHKQRFANCVFSNFGHMTIFAKQKFYFLPAILEQNTVFQKFTFCW